MPNINRQVHPAQGIGKTGSLAGLGDELSSQGFEYQYKAGDPSYHDIGIAHYIHPKTGEKVKLIRIKTGEPAHWLPRPPGAISWLAKTAAQPDTWQLVKEA